MPGDLAVLTHVGLLLNRPPAAAGLPLNKSSNEVNFVSVRRLKLPPREDPLLYQDATTHHLEDKENTLLTRYLRVRGIRRASPFGACGTARLRYR